MVLVGGDGRPTGVPRHILHLADALRDDVDITVISDVDKGGYSDLRRLGVPHVEIRGLALRFSIPRLCWGLFQLLRQLRRAQADLIWIHPRFQVLVCRLMLALRIWRPGCKVIFTHHGLPYGRGYPPHIHVMFKSLERLLVMTCPPHDIVFLTPRMALGMARDVHATGLARHRVHVLPNCSDLRPLPRNTKRDARLLVMTGRTGRQKDYDIALRLFAEFPEHYRLLLCGPGTEDAGFQARAARLVPATALQRITFAGPLPDARLPLSMADAYLLTSRYEGTPIGTLEAFEAGLPVILRDFDGATDLISKHPCALMIGTRNLAKEADRINALIDFFERDKQALHTEIKEVWRTNWSPQIFRRNAQALVHNVLHRTSGPAARTGYGHGVPARHQDRRRNAAARVPEPPPYCTAAAPSVESA